MTSEVRIEVEEDGWKCVLTRDVPVDGRISQWVVSPEGMRFHSHADLGRCPFTEDHARELLSVTRELMGFFTKETED